MQITNISSMDLSFKYQPHKIVKHTQTICQQQPMNCLSVFDHLVGLAFKQFNDCIYAKLFKLPNK